MKLVDLLELVTNITSFTLRSYLFYRYVIAGKASKNQIRLFAKAFLAVTPLFFDLSPFFSLSPAIFGAPFRIFCKIVSFA